ncbi:unnamed protein product [Parascedosporium putredinis]|uniref:Uncharacterized protein n=1 Tax=Parascedosporium putredinis TaxID=1442378 RepID=A0A9P1GZY7_9PEZI|nr:unnamed protein product [Parascedosporium putredinis]CAI7992281.1 unnamed protein product [Parascedosporium putredinis]
MAASCVGADCTEVGVAAEVGAAPTVIVTTTLRRTVTVGSVTSTTVVPVTVFQTLTFQDPALRTQTLTVTITSGAVARSQPLSEVGFNADAVAAVTLTTTVELVATITGVVTVTSALFNTVFVTQTLAPSATATVFTTTTVAPRPEFTGGLLPGGFIPRRATRASSPRTRPTFPRACRTAAPSYPRSGTEPHQRSHGHAAASRRHRHLAPGNPQSMMPTNMNPSPTGPVRPVPGSNLTSDDIAGIALGIIFGLFFLILAGFLIYRLIKKKEALDMSRQQQEMISSGSRSIPVGAASILSNATENRLIKPAPAVMAAGALGSDGTSSTGPGEGDVRIVIRPAPKRRTQSSGLFAPSGSGKGSRATSGASSAAAALAQGSRRAQFPRPPGYNGQTYSFFVEESGSTSPQDPKAWSLASDDGSRAGPGSPADNWTPTFPKPYDPTRRDNGRDRGAGGSGVGGSDFLSVGRALSPWKPI